MEIFITTTGANYRKEVTDKSINLLYLLQK